MQTMKNSEHKSNKFILLASLTFSTLKHLQSVLRVFLITRTTSRLFVLMWRKENTVLCIN